MNTENENKLIETATSKEYVDSALTIIENGTNIKRQSESVSLNSLKSWLRRKGWSFTVMKVCVI